MPILAQVGALALSCGGERPQEPAAAQPAVAASEPDRAPATASPEPPGSNPPIAVDLPRVGLPAGPAVAHAFAVRAGAERLTFTNAPSITAFLARDDREARQIRARYKEDLDVPDLAAALMIRGDADPRAAKNHMIEALFDRIFEAVDTEAQLAERLERPPLRTMALALDAALPMSTVIDILVTSGRGGIERYAIEASASDGSTMIPLSPAVGACSAEDAAARCWGPALWVAADGVFVGLLPPCEGRRPGDRAHAFLVQSKDGGCPSAGRPSVAGALAEVDRLIESLAAHAPICTTSRVGGEGGVVWGELVPVIAALAARGEVLLDSAPPLPTRCEASVPESGIDAKIAAVAGAGDRGELRSDAEVWGGLTPVVAEEKAATKPATTKPATITITATAEKGGVPASLVERICKAHTGEISHCLRSVAPEHRDKAGTLVFAFTISETGDATEIEGRKDTFGDEALATCAARAVKRWKMPAGKTSTAATVTVTIRP